MTAFEQNHSPQSTTHIEPLPRNLPLVSDSDKRRLKSYSLQEGDIVFSRVGSVDRSAIISSKEDGWLFSGRLLRVRNETPEVWPSYLSYYFHDEPFKQRVRNVAVGQTMPSLNTQILKSLDIVLPTLPEQRAIAASLDDVAALIGALDAQIAKKRDLKIAAKFELLRPREEWKEVKLGNLASFHKGKGLPKSELDFYGSEPCIHYGELFLNYPEKIEGIFSKTNPSTGVFLSIANDVLMPTSDVTPNGLAVASSVQVDGVILGGDILVIRTNPTEINGVFLSHLIRSEKEQILQLVTGSTVYHLYAADMKRFTFHLPSIEEQNAIAEVLSDMDAEIAALEAKRDKTRDLKRGMMQELLTGRTRLMPTHSIIHPKWDVTSAAPSNST